MDFHAMKRKELQDLCKKHGIRANIKNVEMADKLASIFKENENTVFIGKSCLKNVVDLASDDCLKDDLRKTKKVRFSPRDELVEYDLEDQSDPRNDRAKARAMRKVARSKHVLNEDQVKSTRSHMRKSMAADVVIDLLSPTVKKRLRSSGKSTDSGFEDDINNLKAADEKELISGPCDENLAGKCESLGNGQIKKRLTWAAPKSNDSVVISETSGTVGFARRLTRSLKKNEEEVLHLEDHNSKRGGRKGVNQKSVGTANAKPIIDEKKKKHDESQEVEAHTKLANENEKDRLPTRRSRRYTSLHSSITSFVASDEFVGRKKPLEQVKESLPCEEISETVKFKRMSTRAIRDLSAVYKEPDMTVNDNRRNGTKKRKMDTVMEAETQKSVANATLLDNGVAETMSENKAVEPVSEVEEIRLPVLNHTKEDNSVSAKMRLRSGRKYTSSNQNGNKLLLSSHRDTVTASEKDTVLMEKIETELTPEVEEVHVPLLNHFKDDDIGSEKMRLGSSSRSSLKKQTGNKLQLSHRNTVTTQDKDTVLTEKVEIELTPEVEGINVPLSNHVKENDIGSEKMRLRSTTKSTSKKQITDKLQLSIMDIVGASEKDSVPIDKEETQEMVANTNLLDKGVVETMSENIAIEPLFEVKEIQVPVLNQTKEDNSVIEKMSQRSGRKSRSKKKNGNKVQLSSQRDTVSAPDKDTVLMENIETELISEVEQIHVPLLTHFKDDIGSEKMKLRSGTKSTSKKQFSDKLQFSIHGTVGAAEKDGVSMDKEEQILPPNYADDDQSCQSQQRKEDVDQIDLDKQEPGEHETLVDDSPVDDSSALHELDSMGKPVSTLSLGVEIEGKEDLLAVKQAHAATELHDCHDDDDDDEDDNVSVYREENSADSKEGTGPLSESVQEYHLDECNESEGPNENCENTLGDTENMFNASDKIGTPMMSPEGVINDDRCYVDAAGNEKTPLDYQASVGRVLSEMFTEIEINTQMHPGEKMENIGNSSAARHIYSSIDFEECLDDDQCNDSNGGTEVLLELSVEKASKASLETLYDSHKTETLVMSFEGVANEDYCSEEAADLLAMVSSSHASSCRIDSPLNAIIDNEHKGMSGHSVTACASRIHNDTQQQEENHMKMDTLDQSSIVQRSSKVNVEDLECCTYGSQSPNVKMCKKDIYGGNSESAINLNERTGDVVMEKIRKYAEAIAELPVPQTDGQVLINRENSSPVKDSMHEVSNGEENGPLSGQFSIEVTTTPTSCSKEESLNHETNIFDRTESVGEALPTMFGSPVFQEALAEDNKKYIDGIEKTPPINMSQVSDNDDCLAGKTGIRIMHTEGGFYSVLYNSTVIADAENRESEVLLTNLETESTQGFHDCYQNMSSFKDMPSMFDHINGQERNEPYVRTSDAIVSENMISSGQTNFQVVDESTFLGANKEDDTEDNITKSTSNKKVMNCEVEHRAFIEDGGGSLPQTDPIFFASGSVTENANASSLLDEVIGHYFFEDGTTKRKEKDKDAFGSVGSKSFPDAKIYSLNYPEFVDHKKDLFVSNSSEDIVKEPTTKNLNVTYECRTEDEGLKRDCDIELCDELSDGDNLIVQMTGSPFPIFEETICEELKESEEKTIVQTLLNTTPDFENANSNINAHEDSSDASLNKASDYASADYSSESAVEVSIIETKDCTNLLADMEKATIRQIDELMSADVSDNEDLMEQELKHSYFNKGDLTLLEENSVAVDIEENLVIEAGESTYNISHVEYGESVEGDFFAETNESYVDSKNRALTIEKVENVADMGYNGCATSVDDIHESVDRVDDTTMNEIGYFELFVGTFSELGTNNMTVSASTTSSFNDDNTPIQKKNEATLEYSMVAKAVGVGSANKLHVSDKQSAVSENSSDVLALKPESISQVESHVFTSRDINSFLEDFEQYEVTEINQNEALIAMTESSTTQNIDAENLHKDHQMDEKVSQPHVPESISEQAAPKENTSDEPIFEHALENAFVSADTVASNEPTTEGVDAQNTQIVQPDLGLNENTSFSSKQLNSSIVKETNSIAELIEGTPQKSAWTHDMKENASMMKTDQTTIVKSTTKRRALEDIQRKS